MTDGVDEGSAAMLGSVAGEPTTEQAAFHRWQEFCKSCGFRHDTPEAMSAFLAGIRCGRAASLTETERLAIEWAAVIAKQQSQVAVHKTLRAMLERTK